MIRAGKQAGFTLLLLLTVLLAASAAALQTLARASFAIVQPVFGNRHSALQDARQALLSYASLYPYLYGPRGAGPGHLPCPDTDYLAAGVAPSASGSPAADGPNPPCGSGPVATGRLPRHVSLPGYRYAFHTEPDQRLIYAVSTAVINNPVNRPVNDSVLNSLVSHSQSLAWLELPLVALSTSSPLIARTTVTLEALMPSVKPAVAAWVLARVSRVSSDGCRNLAIELDSSTLQGMNRLLHLLSDKQSSAASSMSLPSADSSESIGPFRHPAECTSITEHDWTLDATALERVPAMSHWFVRNGWHERIHLKIDASCREQTADQCELVYQQPTRSTATRHQDHPLVFIWQISS